jgi:hypothetical protein
MRRLSWSMRTSEETLHPNFLELRQGEVRLSPGSRKHGRDPPGPYHNAYHN